MTRHLHVAINGLYLIPGAVGGTETYLRELLHSLATQNEGHKYFLYLNRDAAEWFSPKNENLVIRVAPVPGRLRPLRVIWEQLALPLQLATDKIDVLLNAGFTAPASPGRPQATVFHDLQYRRHPEFFRWFDLPFWRFFTWLALKCSDRIVAVSTATARDLGQYYPWVAGKVVTILPSIDPAFFRVGQQRQPQCRNPFLLTVSTLHPHKNLERLIDAFSEFHKSWPEFRLVLVGVKGFRAKHIEAKIHRHQLNGKVIVTGWIPQVELLELYRTCWAFVYPSLFEGFGLPVIEAMAAAIPTACSAIEPLKSHAADCVYYFDPQSTRAIKEALEQICFNEQLRNELTERGPSRARYFSRAAFGRQVVDLLKSLAGG